jgi:hypothetical protein
MPVTLSTINRAIEDAKRFINKANEARVRIAVDLRDAKYDKQDISITSKQTAAARRASMDLSRSLTELRK